MKPGTVARKLLGKKYHALASAYRAFFVDLDLVVSALGQIRKNAAVLDVGGGDGALVEKLLERRKDLRITMIDVRSGVGGALSRENSKRVKKIPNASLDRHAAGCYDLVILSDVLHHVDPAARADLFAGLRRLMENNHDSVLAVKEVEPGYLKSWLSVISDKYITGDPHVQLVGQDELIGRLQAEMPWLVAEKTGLFAKDKPNYCIIFRKDEKRI